MKEEGSKEPLKQVETGAGKKRYECILCKDDTPHMMCVMSKDGSIHVHAPFENKYLMTQFMEAIIEEQKKQDSQAVSAPGK